LKIKQKKYLTKEEVETPSARGNVLSCNSVLAVAINNIIVKAKGYIERKGSNEWGTTLLHQS
jgi:hypothetical protein